MFRIFSLFLLLTVCFLTTLAQAEHIEFPSVTNGAAFTTDGASVILTSRDDAPEVTVTYPNGGEDFDAGDAVTVTWDVVTDQTNVSSLVEYSLDGGSSWIEIGTVNDANEEIQWEVPNLFNLYVVVRVTSTDDQDQSGSDVSDDWFTIGPVETTHEFYRGWSFFSLPYVPENGSVESIIEAGIIDQQPWDLFGFEMATSYFRPETLFCGSGYALTLVQDTLTTTFNCAAHRELVETPLDFGWNFIGVPFGASIEAEDLHVRYDGDLYTLEEAAEVERYVPDTSAHDTTVYYGICVPVFYTWDAADSIFTLADPIEPWTSYFFVSLVDTNHSFELMMLPAPPGPVPTQMDEVLGTFESWRLNITATLDGKTDRTTALGAKARATDHFDPAFDYPEPPTGQFNSVVNAYFHHPEWHFNFGSEFCRDIRAQMVEESDIWTLTVAASREGEVTLRWPDIFRTTPPGYEFEIVDNLSREVINPRLTRSYTYHADAGIRAFSVRVQASLGVKDIQASPIDHDLLRAYPNPFNASINLNYSVAEDGLVSLEVFNLQGRLVNTLAKGRVEAGSHSLTWQAEALPAGLYIVKMTTPNGQTTQKLLLLK